MLPGLHLEGSWLVCDMKASGSEIGGSVRDIRIRLIGDFEVV